MSAIRSVNDRSQVMFGVSQLALDSVISEASVYQRSERRSSAVEGLQSLGGSRGPCEHGTDEDQTTSNFKSRLRIIGRFPRDFLEQAEWRADGPQQTPRVSRSCS